MEADCTLYLTESKLFHKNFAPFDQGFHACKWKISANKELHVKMAAPINYGQAVKATINSNE